MGFVMYFQVLSVSSGRQQNTHPLSSRRVEAVAQGIAARPAAFMDPAEDPTCFTPRVLAAADTLRKTAQQIDRPEVLRNFDELARITDWPNLATDLPLLLRIGACQQ